MQNIQIHSKGVTVLLSIAMDYLVALQLKIQLKNQPLAEAIEIHRRKSKSLTVVKIT